MTVLADLAGITEPADELGVESPAEDFDLGLTTDDMSVERLRMS